MSRQDEMMRSSIEEADAFFLSLDIDRHDRETQKLIKEYQKFSKQLKKQTTKTYSPYKGAPSDILGIIADGISILESLFSSFQGGKFKKLHESIIEIEEIYKQTRQSYELVKNLLKQAKRAYADSQALRQNSNSSGQQPFVKLVNIVDSIIAGLEMIRHLANRDLGALPQDQERILESLSVAQDGVDEYRDALVEGNIDLTIRAADSLFGMALIPLGKNIVSARSYARETIEKAKRNGPISGTIRKLQNIARGMGF